MANSRYLYGPTTVAPSPDVPENHELVLTLGDLHGNLMILVEGLVSRGLMVSGDKAAHKALGDAYLNFLNDFSYNIK